MKELEKLLAIVDQLLSPHGCPWDREQTLQTIRSCLIEETYEVIEAIDLDHNAQIEEELGDLLFLVFFSARLAEKEKRFTLADAARHVSAKLIRRHPHVFGEAKIQDADAALQQWEEIKKQEKNSQARPSAIDGIPKDLPLLSRAHKVAKKFARQKFTPKSQGEYSKEDEAGQSLWSLVQHMQQEGVEAEQALRKRLLQVEREFREWEAAQ